MRPWRAVKRRDGSVRSSRCRQLDKTELSVFREEEAEEELKRSEVKRERYSMGSEEENGIQ